MTLEKICKERARKVNFALGINPLSPLSFSTKLEKIRLKRVLNSHFWSLVLHQKVCPSPFSAKWSPLSSKP